MIMKKIMPIKRNIIQGQKIFSLNINGKIMAICFFAVCNDGN